MASPAPAPPIITDRFAVIPIMPPGVEVRRDSRAMIHLRSTTPPPGLAWRIGRFFNFNFSQKLELDEHGSFFFSQIDGVTPLTTIIDRMAVHLDVPREEAEKMVIMFTKKLMMTNMVALQVPDTACARRPDEQA